MELPHLGESCSNNECNRLDFLPYKCDLCSKIFCQDHREYKDHSCPEQYRVDRIVPVCPKCGEIIPVKPGDDPNIKVNSHIENNCSKVPKVKTYPNRCNKQGCKKKEAIPVHCKNCKLNFCLAHRFEQDHSCKGFVHPLVRKQETAKPKPKPKPKPATNSAPIASSSQQISQDEALARALATEEDEALARALQASLSEQQPSSYDANRRSQPQRQDSQSSCVLS